MKRLWVKHLSLLLILAQTSVLFADTLKFKNGLSITGTYLEQDTDIVLFQVDGKQQIPQVAVSKEMDENKFLFKKSHIEFVKNDNGDHLLDEHNQVKYLKFKFNEDIIWFYSNGIPAMKLKGELISVKLNQDINPKTGFTSEVIFKPFNKKHVPKLYLGGIVNNGEDYIFDLKNIYKIINITSTTDELTFANFEWSTTLYSKDFQINYRNRKDMNSIIHTDINDKLTRVEFMDKTGKNLMRGSCIFLALYFLFFWSP